MARSPPAKNGSSAGCCARRPRLDPQKPSSEAVFTAAVPCFQRPIRRHRRARVPPTPMRRHEQRWKVHTRRDRCSRALVGSSEPFSVKRSRRAFSDAQKCLKIDFKRRTRSAGALLGLVAAVATPRPESEALLSTMITAATASRPPFDPADWGAAQKVASRNPLKI